MRNFSVLLAFAITGLGIVAGGLYVKSYFVAAIAGIITGIVLGYLGLTLRSRSGGRAKHRRD